MKPSIALFLLCSASLAAYDKNTKGGSDYFLTDLDDRGFYWGQGKHSTDWTAHWAKRYKTINEMSQWEKDHMSVDGPFVSKGLRKVRIHYLDDVLDPELPGKAMRRDALDNGHLEPIIVTPIKFRNYDSDEALSQLQHYDTQKGVAKEPFKHTTIIDPPANMMSKAYRQQGKENLVRDGLLVLRSSDPNATSLVPPNSFVPWDQYDSFLEPVDTYRHGQVTHYGGPHDRREQERTEVFTDGSDASLMEHHSAIHQGLQRNRLVFDIAPWKQSYSARFSGTNSEAKRMGLGRISDVDAARNQLLIKALDSRSLDADVAPADRHNIAHMRASEVDYITEDGTIAIKPDHNIGDLKGPEIKRGRAVLGGWLGQDGEHLDDSTYWHLKQISGGDELMQEGLPDGFNEAFNGHPIRRGVGRLAPAGLARQRWNPQEYWRPWLHTTDPTDVLLDQVAHLDEWQDGDPIRAQFRFALDRWVDDNAASPYFKPLVKLVMVMDELEDATLRLADRVDNHVYNRYPSSVEETEFNEAMLTERMREVKALQKSFDMRKKTLSDLMNSLSAKVYSHDLSLNELDSYLANWLSRILDDQTSLNASIAKDTELFNNFMLLDPQLATSWQTELEANDKAIERAIQSREDSILRRQELSRRAHERNTVLGHEVIPLRTQKYKQSNNVSNNNYMGIMTSGGSPQGFQHEDVALEFPEIENNIEDKIDQGVRQFADRISRSRDNADIDAEFADLRRQKRTVRTFGNFMNDAVHLNQRLYTNEQQKRGLNNSVRGRNYLRQLS